MADFWAEENGAGLAGVPAALTHHLLFGEALIADVY